MNVLLNGEPYRFEPPKTESSFEEPYFRLNFNGVDALHAALVASAASMLYFSPKFEDKDAILLAAGTVFAIDYVSRRALDRISRSLQRYSDKKFSELKNYIRKKQRGTQTF